MSELKIDVSKKGNTLLNEVKTVREEKQELGIQPFCKSGVSCVRGKATLTLISLLTETACKMATWTAFYVKTKDEESLTDKLKSLSGINNSIVSKFPPDHYGSFLVNEVPPSYLVFTGTQPGWVTVVYNSAHKLTDWSIDISRQFNTQVIVTQAQSVSSYYYFALYEKGEKVRELEYCYSTDFEPTNFGNKFDFEGEEPGQKLDDDGEDSYLFDFDSIEKYCDHFGLIIQTNYHEHEWTVLKSKRIGKTVSRAVRAMRKPWWKFW